MERLELLKVLELNARLSSAEIALRLGAKEEEVAEAIRELEREGIIRRYKTVVDWEKAGVEKVYAFIDVKVSPAREVGFDDVAERLYRFPEVHSVYLVSGEYDLRVVVEGDSMKSVAFFVAERLATIDRVLSTATHFLLRKYKEDGFVFEEPGENDRLMISP